MSEVYNMVYVVDDRNRQRRRWN